MPRIIWRTFKSSLCKIHNRHHKGRAGATVPGWIQLTQSFILGKLQDQLFFWKWWWHWLEKEEAGSVLCLWACKYFHLSLSQEYGFQACLEETEKNFHSPCIQYYTWSINSLGFKLDRYYKVKKTIFRLKESNKAFFSSLFKFSVEGKTLEMEAGHLTSSAE